MPDQLGLSGADGVKATEAKSETQQELATSQEVRALQHLTLCDDISFLPFKFNLLMMLLIPLLAPRVTICRVTCLFVPSSLQTELS